MRIDRRAFLKFAGLTTLAGFLGKSAVTILASEQTARLVNLNAVPSARRWGMIVDLRKCRKLEGCTDCIKACHTVHNVPQFDDPKDEIKWVWKEDFEHAFQEQEHEFTSDEIKRGQVLLLCNHCNNAPCVRVCPTKATWKREDGIVMMDMHRCIGCRYCVAACPYGSRSFNWRDPRPFIKEINPDFPTRMRGVVEKCNFCAERLVKDQLPACVEACPEKALLFGDLENSDSEIRRLLNATYTLRRKPSLGTQPEVYYIV